jgi:prepilin peptidase CpaA
VVLVASLLTAVTDIWRLRVHNLITLPLLVAGLVYHSWTGGVEGFAASLLGALFGFGALISFYIIGGMGAGDVKLLAGVGAWLGVWPTFWVFAVSALAMGGYSLALVVARGRSGEAWVRLQILWHRLVAIGRYLGAEQRVEAEAARGGLYVIPFAAMVPLGILSLLVYFWVARIH